ncbi:MULTISPECIES: prepilin peptidase-dependent protein [unclassified Brenneria]|uniref:prepilin peptidase-dependent protein n=1 Tax=unclassified Brenneria TaxID=2634434 RepID=UPI0015561F2E|nr:MULTISPECIES: prepilin peptidase-dependent protein [unclassified Brenneria]MBJ7221935.1 prepilin peptidase-dependent protein [Brenneria sp. L3-3C-1]MEE3643178.1 prepilin peptidase-dependent protein [Brenneria sp. L3_3C_1]MEE3650635.1 prepilin peptidase-dependent protein [Brenneria sp. HEZEL_4_2_4]NPD00590.1 prepilin peptidase-dependent protein [Brenneria sp. hezel4-2-4]
MLREQGFTLAEVLLALSLSSLIMLSAAQLYPILRAQSQNSAQHFRLEQLFSQVVSGIEKDLRRAGFCAGECRGRALSIGQYPGEAPQSCLNVSYDLNRNGVWDGGEQQDAESFGYRLRAGALEIQSGVHHCQGDRWEKLFDPREVALTQFRLQRLAERPGVVLYELQLAGYWTKRPVVRRKITRLIVGRNQ